MSIATNDKIESQRASKREKQSTHNILKWHEGSRRKKNQRKKKNVLQSMRKMSEQESSRKKTEVKSKTEKSSKKGKIGPLILVVKDISICPRSS